MSRSTVRCSAEKRLLPGRTLFFLPLLLIALAASLLACDRSASDGGGASVAGDGGVDGDWEVDARTDAATDVGTDAGTDTGTALAPLAELRQRCMQAGGQFVAGECICPTEQVGGVPVRETFDARFAACALSDSPGDSECLARGSFTQVLDKEGLGALRDCLQYFVVYPFRALRFEIPEEWSSEDARPLARWLDERFQPGTMKLNAKLSTPVTTDLIDILLASQSIARDKLSISVRPPAIDPGDLNNAATRVLHVPSVDALDRALGDSAAWRPARNTEPPTEAGNVALVIETAIAEMHLDVDGATIVKPILQNCLGMCDVQQDYLFGEDGPVYAAWRIRRYQTGVLYRETLAVGSPDHHRVDGMVIFDLGGDPSLILRVERSSRLKPTVFVYDRNWNKLGAFPFDLLPDIAKANTVIQSAAPLGEGESGIVLCDSGITFEDDAINSALLVGENLASPDQPNGSALGWLLASASDAAGFLDGVRTTARGIIPFEDFPTIHGASMARILLERRDPKLRIVSTSFERCLARADALQELAAWDLAHSATESNKRNGKIRVVNLSAAEVIDREACAAQYPAGLDSHYLWVTAAGNSGRLYTAEAPLSRCPQTLPNRANLLVIAAAEASNYPWRYSDVGSTYADLGADCTGQSGSCGGTSNSAPRVSRTAALIVQRYGDAISNEMVRMAILLGATVPKPAPPYRSGGYHSHDDAMSAAGSLIDENLGQSKSIKRSDAQRVLDAFPWSDSYKKQKLDLLEANGAFDR